jgi:ABC-type spermidine/putrescine transport system permease subunit II
MWSLVADRIDPIDLMPVSRHARRTRNLLAILTGAIIAFLYIPIVFLVLFSFETSNTP